MNILPTKPDPDRFQVQERVPGTSTIVGVFGTYGDPGQAGDEITRLLATYPGRFDGHDLVVTDKRGGA